jgi:tetratricopeptide (TPR) repeat protein
MSRSVWLGAWLAGLASVSWAQQIADADAALGRFELEQALAIYRAVHQRQPDNYEATWKLCRALVDKGTLSRQRAEQKQLFVEAERLAREAVRLNPSDAKGHTYLAIALGKLALFEGGRRKVELSKEVKSEAEKAIELNPAEDLAHHVLGVWNREMVELNWVLKKFAEFLYGRFPPASLQQALEHLRRAAELAPATVPHRVELGITLAAAHNWTEAAAELQRALAMPKAWVTDEYYWQLAGQTLERVKRHLRD